MTRRRHRVPTFRPSAEVLDDRCLLSGLTPAQITHAYGLDALTFASGTVILKDPPAPLGSERARVRLRVLET